MRRRSMTATGTIAPLVLTLAPILATAQDDFPVVSLGPPVDVLPAPAHPDPSPSSAGPHPAARIESHSRGQASRLLANPGRSEGPLPALPTIGPPSAFGTGTGVRAPIQDARPVGDAAPTRVVLSPVILPPVRPEEDGAPVANPLLPPGPGRARGARSETAVPDDERPADSRAVPADRPRPGRLGGLLDRLPIRLPGPPPAPATGEAAESPAIDPDDPEQVAALRQALERRIVGRDGGRLVSLEVLIVGRRVHIRAEAARPWQRRALRRDLEAVPMPAGFRSTVEVR